MNTATTLKDGIAVRNAGLVIVNGYFPMLVERLGLAKDGKFLNDEAELTAVNVLQFLATGSSTPEGHSLTLNKVLCGLSPSSATVETAIKETDKQLIESLLKAAISHWPVSGGSSISGFRGNWLIRDGLLTEIEDKWELVVERRPYDLLLKEAPFSFSSIRFSWMSKPLTVNWYY